MRKVLGALVLVVIAVEVGLVLTGVIDFGSAARLVIAMELFLSVFAIAEIVIVLKAVRRAKASGLDLPAALDESLAAFFPGRVARYLRQEIMMVRALFMLLTGRRDVAEGEHPIRYASSLVVLLMAVTVGDAVAAVLLHRLLPAGLRPAALVLGVLGVVWLLGFVASLICYPHVVSADRLRLRFSVFHDITVPTAAVRSVGTTSRTPRTQKVAELFDDELVMVVTGQSGVVVELDDADFASLNPNVDDAGTLRRITFHADEPSRARDLVAAVMEG